MSIIPNYTQLAVIRMPPKGILRVELVETDNSDCNNTVHVSYSNSDSVLSIKHKLHQLTGIPADSQTLYHPAVYLSDGTPVHLLSRSADSIPTIRMHVVARGGASRPTGMFEPFQFLDISGEDCFESLQPVSSGPAYLTICQGLNLIATCDNKLCVSTGRIVSIMCGMHRNSNGYCCVRTQVCRMKCPACNAKISSSNWKNIIIFDCTADFEWVFSDGGDGSLTVVTEEGMYKQPKETNELKLYEALNITLK